MKFTLTFSVESKYTGTVYIIKQTIENILRLGNVSGWKWEQE